MAQTKLEVGWYNIWNLMNWWDISASMIDCSEQVTRGTIFNGEHQYFLYEKSGPSIAYAYPPI